MICSALFQQGYQVTYSVTKSKLRTYPPKSMEMKDCNADFFLQTQFMYLK